MKPTSFLVPLLAAVALAVTPATTFAKDRKVTVQRDLDGDGHYNKKTYKVPHNRGHNYGHSYGHHSPYYGHSYRPYSYGYGSSYYAYPRTSFGVSFYSPQTATRVYRGVEYNNSLATDVQSALRRKGYYRGAIDGDIGPASRAAIRAYQRAHGLSATGRIDSALLRSLRVG
ncbi:MAG: peptidoglycan-binding protein [Chthoniobacteraceae bacterium]